MALADLRALNDINSTQITGEIVEPFPQQVLREFV